MERLWKITRFAVLLDVSGLQEVFTESTAVAEAQWKATWQCIPQTLRQKVRKLL
jgi:hypothetical protein